MPRRPASGVLLLLGGERPSGQPLGPDPGPAVHRHSVCPPHWVSPSRSLMPGRCACPMISVPPIQCCGRAGRNTGAPSRGSSCAKNSWAGGGARQPKPTEEPFPGPWAGFRQFGGGQTAIGRAGRKNANAFCNFFKFCIFAFFNNFFAWIFLVFSYFFLSILSGFLRCSHLYIVGLLAIEKKSFSL